MAFDFFKDSESESDILSGTRRLHSEVYADLKCNHLWCLFRSEKICNCKFVIGKYLQTRSHPIQCYVYVNVSEMENAEYIQTTTKGFIFWLGL